eukprot:scpid58907/ scgid3558/ 
MEAWDERVVQPLSKLTGETTEVVHLFLCMVACLPVALFHRLFFFRVSPTIQLTSPESHCQSANLSYQLSMPLREASILLHHGRWLVYCVARMGFLASCYSFALGIRSCVRHAGWNSAIIHFSDRATGSSCLGIKYVRL